MCTNEGCNSLTSVSLPSRPPVKETNIFIYIGSSSAYKAISIRVPSGSIGNYSSWHTTDYGGYVNVTFVEY